MKSSYAQLQIQLAVEQVQHGSIRLFGEALRPGIPERHKTICPKLIASAVRILEEMAREAE